MTINCYLSTFMEISLYCGSRNGGLVVSGMSFASAAVQLAPPLELAPLGQFSDTARTKLSVNHRACALHEEVSNRTPKAQSAH